MADVTFEANGLLIVRSEMLAVVAAKAPRPIFVTDVVWMRGPQFILGGKDHLLVRRFQIVHGGSDLGRVAFVVLGVILSVEGLQGVYGFVGFGETLVTAAEDLGGFQADVRNGLVNPPERQRLVHRLFGRAEYVRDAVVAVNTVHAVFRRAFDFIRRQGVLDIHVDRLFTSTIGDLNPRNILFEFVRGDKVHLVFDVPVDAKAAPFAPRAPAGFHEEIGDDFGILLVVVIMPDGDGAVSREFFGPMAAFARITRGEHIPGMEGKRELTAQKADDMHQVAGFAREGRRNDIASDVTLDATDARVG